MMLVARRVCTIIKVRFDWFLENSADETATTVDHSDLADEQKQALFKARNDKALVSFE